jgi:hypothetical protein
VIDLATGIGFSYPVIGAAQDQSQYIYPKVHIRYIGIEFEARIQSHGILADVQSFFGAIISEPVIV